MANDVYKPKLSEIERVEPLKRTGERTRGRYGAPACSTFGTALSTPVNVLAHRPDHKDKADDCKPDRKSDDVE